MFERIVEWIGNFLSSIFRKGGDIMDDARVEANMFKEQARATKTKTAATFNISISGESHVNYFRNRVIGEFLRVMVAFVPYKYDNTTGRFVVYFVRNRRRSVVEYIKFSKPTMECKNADISYTVINKIISSTGMTTDIGNTQDKVLHINDMVSTCIYDSIDSKKAPLYLVHDLDGDIKVGNPTFVYKCWVVMCKLIIRRVDAYCNRPEGTPSKDSELIEKLMTQAGIHMFMSYFRSIDNIFYKNCYRTATINKIVDAINRYNDNHFNVNKITKFSYEPDTNRCSVEVSEDKKFSIFNLQGVTIKFSGVITETGDAAMRRFNYKLAEVLLRAEDEVLKRNFLFYIFSTGGIEDNEIVKLQEEQEQSKTYSDFIITNLNERVEPTVGLVMADSGFKENVDGDFSSKVFEQAADTEVAMESNTEKIAAPIILPPTVTPIENSKIDKLKEESQSIRIEESTTIPKIGSNRLDPVNVLRQDTGDSGVSQKPETSKGIMDSIVEEDVDFRDLRSIPLAQWTSEDCLAMLGSDESLDNGVTRQDIVERMMFLSNKK